MKRYLLFGYNQYYPRGGWYDLQGSFDTPQEAIKAAKTGESMVAEVGYDWWHIIDTETMSIVVTGHGDQIPEADDRTWV